jgi:hypothetical protein
VSLKEEDYDTRTWIIMRWVRDYVLYEGEFPDGTVAAAFRTAYSVEEQKAVFATLKLILFFNMLFNVFDRKGSRLIRE